MGSSTRTLSPAMPRLVIVCGLIAAASTLDSILLPASCGCSAEWFRPAAEGPVYVPALAVALVAAIRLALVGVPPPSRLPMAFAGRGRWRASAFTLRVRCAASRPLRLLVGVVSGLATAMVVLLLLVLGSGEDNEPFLWSHLLLVGVIIANRVARRAGTAIRAPASSSIG